MAGTAVLGGAVGVLILRKRFKTNRFLVSVASSFGAMAMMIAGMSTVSCQRFLVENFGLGWALVFVGTSIIPAWVVGIFGAGITAKFAPALGAAEWIPPRWCWPVALAVSVLPIGIPAKAKDSDSTATRASVAIVSPPPLLPSGGAPSAPPGFLFLPPPSLPTTGAFRVESRFEYSLGTILAGSEFVIHSDSRLVAFNSAGSLCVADLNTARILKTFPAPEPLASISFRPDGQRVIFDLKRDRREVFICDMASGAVIRLPRPKLREVPPGRKFWWADDEVLCYAAKGVEYLNLDTLEMDRMEVSSKWTRLGSALQSTWALKPLVPSPESSWNLEFGMVPSDAELPDVEDSRPWRPKGPKYVWASNKERFMQRALGVQVEEGDTYFLTPDMAKVVRYRRGNLDVIYLGVRGNGHPAAYGITMPHRVEEAPNRTSIEKAMRSKSLTVVVYAPMKNPLNGKVVGPDRTRMKAGLRFSKWEGTKAEAWVVELYQEIQPGDVVADINVNVGGQLELMVLATTHRWWSVLGESAPLRIFEVPTRHELAALVTEPNPVAPVISPLGPRKELATSLPRQSDEKVESRLKSFLLEHHRKASRRDSRGLVADYAPTVDYLTKGRITPVSILQDEEQYHAGLSELLEEIIGPVKIAESEANLFEVSYTMTSQGKTKKGEVRNEEFEISMEIRLAGDQFEIAKQRSEKVDPK